jgi:CHASE1-domain containing sensor protein
MGHDRRTYRFVQDTQNGPVVLTESTSSEEIARSVTKYVARRMVERERALAAHDRSARWYGRRHWTSWRSLGMFLFGLVLGIAVVLAVALIAVMRSH